MNLEPFDWSVVVIGYWNLAILTPAGIGRRLFGLPEGTPMLVEVPLDGLAPHRVKYDALTVTADIGRLAVYADNPEYALLERAKQIAVRAMTSLPETPFSAAGFNVRFKAAEAPDELLAAMAAELDNLLSDAEFDIQSRVLRRSLKHGDGALNLSIQQGPDVRVELNFDRQSTKRDDLIAWLQLPIDDIGKTIERILTRVVQMPLQGVTK